MTEVLQAKPEIVDRDKAKSINSFEKIEFSKYTFSYPKTDLEILKGLDLNIISGKSLGIVGKTGSGKSTLIRQLLRRFPVNDDDSLKIDGVSVSPVTKNNFLNMEADHKVEATFTISQDRKMELMQKGFSWINLKLLYKIANFG